MGAAFPFARSVQLVDPSSVEIICAHLSVVKKLIREDEVEPETSPPAGLRKSWARVADFLLQKLEPIL